MLIGTPLLAINCDTAIQFEKYAMIRPKVLFICAIIIVGLHTLWWSFYTSIHTMLYNRIPRHAYSLRVIGEDKPVGIVMYSTSSASSTCLLYFTVV